MTVSVVFAIAGVIALLFGIVGGGIKAKEIEVPLLSARARAVTIFAGIILIGFTVWMENSKNTPAPFTPTLPTTSRGVQPDEEFSLKLLSEAQNWDLIANAQLDSKAWPKDRLNEEDFKGNQELTADGTYLVTLNNTGESLDDGFWIIPTLEQVSDFYLNLYGKLVEGRAGNSYGIIFRSNGFEPPAYVFRVFDQAYDVQVIDDEWQELTGMTPSPYLLPDRLNRLTVIAEGSDFYFYINGTFVHHVTDDRIDRGNVGLRISVHQGIEQIVEFDNFELRVPR